MPGFNPTNSNLTNTILFTILIFGFVMSSHSSSSCIAFQDSVFLNSGKPVRGRVKESTPEELLVDTQRISVKDVKDIKLGGAPRELTRAKEDIEKDRFEDAWDKIQQIDPAALNGLVSKEFEYTKALTMGRIALIGGPVSTQQAGREIGAFVQKNPNSFRILPIRDLYGQLLVSINRIDLAEAEFEKMAASDWPEIQLKGLFNLGQAQLLINKSAEAIQTFGQLEQHELNTPMAQQFKLLARCQKAKAMAMNGKSDEAKTAIETLIKNENPDNKELFAYCYNALGVCHLEKRENQAAAIAFLHTDLLFSSTSDAHAEALYRLALLWPKLEETDRANRARQTLSGSYGNSFWKQKLDSGN